MQGCIYGWMEVEGDAQTIDLHEIEAPGRVPSVILKVRDVLWDVGMVQRGEHLHSDRFNVLLSNKGMEGGWMSLSLHVLRLVMSSPQSRRQSSEPVN